MTNKTVVVPEKESSVGKKEQVKGMFDSISGKYDFLNHFLSLGIDKGWRRKTIKALQDIQPNHILDVASGTGDLAIEALTLNPKEVIGIDISEGMMAVGRKKLQDKGLSHKIKLQTGDCENLEFKDNRFDAITCAFGVRNFEHLEKGISEMARTLRQGGKVSIVELSTPQIFPLKQLYHFYFHSILPLWGKMVSKDDHAYNYLPESVEAFPKPDAFCSLLEENGFKNAQAHSLTFGISTLFVATKS